MNNDFVSLSQKCNPKNDKSCRLNLKASNSGRKIISRSPVLIGQLYPPPIPFGVDSHGKDESTQGIGYGIEHVRVPSWHEILMDLIRDTVEKGNEKGDENRIHSGPPSLSSEVYERCKQPVFQKMVELIGKGKNGEFLGCGKRGDEKNQAHEDE